MVSSHLVDSELKPALEIFPFTNLSAETLPSVRAMMAAMPSAPVPENPPVVVTERFVAGPPNSPPVRILVYQPTMNRQLPAIFHIHGGGYVMGTPEMLSSAHRFMAADLGCVIVSVDYRLAPETSHPKPIEDCYTALEWVYDNAANLGVDPLHIGVAGESAGGGLAAALALLTRDRGKVPLRFQHLIYPMLDDRTCVMKEPHPYVGEYIWTRESNRFGWLSYLGATPGEYGISCYAAAARADNLKGLPPAFIATGSLDLFLEEDMDYARRLSRAGVAMEMHVYPGAFHGFQMMPGARVSIAAERDSMNALRRALHRSGSSL